MKLRSIFSKQAPQVIHGGLEAAHRNRFGDFKLQPHGLGLGQGLLDLGQEIQLTQLDRRHIDGRSQPREALGPGNAAGPAGRSAGASCPSRLMRPDFSAIGMKWLGQISVLSSRSNCARSREHTTVCPSPWALARLRAR